MSISKNYPFIVKGFLRTWEEMWFIGMAYCCCNEKRGGLGRWRSLGVSLGPWRSKFLFPFRNAFFQKTSYIYIRSVQQN